MYQSSTRNNFLDILLDPTAIAILASIALHAIIGATLPFFTQPEKEGKKAGPTTVKVVELTPSELQRIPQAPPTPIPQASPPVTPPATANSPSTASPSTPQFSTAPQTIPFSPIRIPLETATPKPSSGKKQQPTTTQKQADAPIFDPNSIFKPNPKPTKSPIPKGVTPKPSVQPTPTPTPPSITKKTQTSTSPTSPQTSATDDDGSEQPPTTTPTTKPKPQAQNPAGTTQPSGSPNSSPKPTPSTQPTGSSQGDGRDYNREQAIIAKEIEYRKKYPDLVTYDKALKQNYPPGVPCLKSKQLQVIVYYMVVFDKVPENQDNNVLGNITPDSLDATAFADEDTPENRKLSIVAKDAAIFAANTADRDRPAADKGKRVLYRYKVEFTCKSRS